MTVMLVVIMERTTLIGAASILLLLISCSRQSATEHRQAEAHELRRCFIGKRTDCGKLCSTSATLKGRQLCVSGLSGWREFSGFSRWR